MYTGFFPDSRFPTPYSLLPKIQDFLPKKLGLKPRPSRTALLWILRNSFFYFVLIFSAYRVSIKV